MPLPLKDKEGRSAKLSGHGPILFLGLVNGHWQINPDFGTDKPEAVNMGISIIVPAKKILEILYHPELVELRARFTREIMASAKGT